MIVNVLKIRSEAVMPNYAHDGDSGFDFFAAANIRVCPQSFGTLVPTGLAFEIPCGFELQIRPRSGMTKKTHIRVSNSPGTVDSSYRGEVGILIDNLAPYGSRPFFIRKGDKIAQGVIAPVVRAELVEAQVLTDTERGGGGFGSTGQ